MPHFMQFLSFVVFSPHDMNVFVTDLTVEYVVTHMQGFSSRILMMFFEKLSDMKESRLTCGSHAQ